MATDLSIYADIVPDRGLGNLALRTHISKLYDLISGLGQWKEGSCNLISPYEAIFRPGKGEIEISVDIRNGKVFKLTASDGYKGKLFGQIGVGMNIGQLISSFPDFYYYEAEEYIACKGVSGIALSISETDPPLEKLPYLSVSAISVYVREMDTIQGQKGEW